MRFNQGLLSRPNEGSVNRRDTVAFTRGFSNHIKKWKNKVWHCSFKPIVGVLHRNKPCQTILCRNKRSCRIMIGPFGRQKSPAFSHVHFVEMTATECYIEPPFSQILGLLVHVYIALYVCSGKYSWLFQIYQSKIASFFLTAGPSHNLEYHLHVKSLFSTLFSASPTLLAYTI